MQNPRQLMVQRNATFVFFSLKIEVLFKPWNALIKKASLSTKKITLAQLCLHLMEHRHKRILAL